MKLEGVRVIDLSLFLPGPHLTMMMADHGAEVIKVEPPTGEPVREIGLKKNGQAVWFRNTHRGKKSLCLNLKNETAREALLKLCETADVFVEAFRPGAVARLGIDYEAVKARNPRIVYCSISAFGQTGPHAHKPAHDLSIQAMAGLVSVNLGNDNEPTNPGVPAADMAASLMALTGILMALYKRETTGRGDYIDMSMQDALLAWTPNVMGPVFAEQRAPIPKHERSWGGAAFYKVYKTKDAKHLVLGGSELKFVKNLLTALGRPDLIAVCENPPGPAQDPVKTFLQECFLGKTLAQWEHWFADKDVCFAPVKDLYQAVHDEHTRERAMLLYDDEQNEHLGVPIKFQQEPARPQFNLPAIGQHNREILSDLGFSEEDIAALENKE